MKTNSTRKRRALHMVLAATMLIFNSAQAIAENCPTCGKHDGKAGELIPKEAPVVPETAPDLRRALQGGARGDLLKGGTDGTLLKTGTEGVLLQTGTAGTLLQTGTGNTLLQSGVERQVPELNALILIDCSHSMKEGLSGALSMGSEQKMDAAKRVLQEAMAMLPSDVNVGLRVFGNSYHGDEYQDCQQSALLVPLGVHNRRAIMESVRQIRPFGLTPLTYALHEAAQDLAPLQGKKQIILISDGAETCGNDPCKFIAELRSKGFDIRVDIVGLALRNDPAARAQLDCIAETSGGKFMDSNTSAELVDNIKQILPKKEVSGKVLTKMQDPSLLSKPGQLPPADLR